MDLMNPEEPGIAASTGLKARAAGLVVSQDVV